jgi:hypothetical protein
LQILEQFPDTALLLPLHKNPTVREPLQKLLEDNSKATQSEWSNLPLQAFELVDSQRGQAKVDLATVKKPQELSQIQSVAVKSLYIADEIQFSSTGKITIKVTPADKR